MCRKVLRLKKMYAKVRKKSPNFGNNTTGFPRKRIDVPSDRNTPFKSFAEVSTDDFSSALLINKKKRPTGKRRGKVAPSSKFLTDSFAFEFSAAKKLY